MRNRRLLAVIGLVLAVVLFVGLNTFGSIMLRGYKLDATANHQFTLSEGTAKVLAGLKEPVALRLYVSRALREADPGLASYADRVRETLKAYVAQATGMLALEQIDPEQFSAEEDRAVGFGLQPIAIDASNTGYFGIAGTNSTDDVDVIPVLAPSRERFLEYDLTRLVYNLANPDKPVMAVMSGLPINGDPMAQYRPWTIYEQLSQLYDVRYLGGEITSLDPEVRLLLLVHPASLSAKSLYAVDQFVLRGGKVMLFVDPHSEAAAMRQRGQQQPTPQSSTLEPLLTAWGVKFDPTQVVADATYARQVQYPVGGRQQVVDYLAWLAIDPPGLAPDDTVTADLKRVTVASAGFVQPSRGAATQMTPLISTSPQSQAIPVERAALFPDPLGLLRSFQPGDKPLAIAARVTGPVRSAYPDELPEGVEPDPGRLTESSGPISVVVVADTDLLEDRAWLASQASLGQNVMVPVADNASFVANALDYLAGSEALSSLRGRDVTPRPFTRVNEIRRAAETAYRAKEQDLLGKLSELQQKLTTLDVGASDDGSLMSEKQKQELDGFRAQMLETRGELRETQRALRSDIEQLRDRLRFLNILAVPLVVAIVGLLVALAKVLRYRRRTESKAA